jgi:hypothetical protein
LKKLPVLALGLLLGGCYSGPAITSGTVIAKNYDPPHTIETYTLAGKVMVPIFIPVGPSWQVEVRDKNKQKAWLNVDQSTFNRLHDGDHYKEP